MTEDKKMTLLKLFSAQIQASDGQGFWQRR